MKKIFLIFGLLISLYSFGNETDKDRELKEIYKSFNTLSEAVNQVNVNQALNQIDNRIVFVNIPGTVTYGLEGIKKYFDIMLLAKDAYLKSAQFDFKIVGEPLIIDNRIALANGHSINRYTFSTGNKMDMPVDWTGAMIKENGKWKVISLHVAGNVFKNPLLDKMYWIFGIVLVLSITIFSGIFFWLGRKTAK